MLGLCAFQLGRSLGLAESDVRSKLDRLLAQHRKGMEGFHGFSRTDFIFGQLGQGVQVMNLLDR